MPNRILKESICASPNIDQLSDKAEAFFYRLIVNSDDYGRFDGRPSIIISRCYPLRIKGTTEGMITNLLMELSKAKLIIVFTKEESPFIQISTWDKHQQIRAKKSKYPAYDNTCKQLIADAICKQLIADDSEEIPDSNQSQNIGNSKQLITDDGKCARNPIQSNPIQSRDFSDTLKQMVEIYEEEIGSVATPMIAERIKDVEQEYNLGIFRAGLKNAVSRGKRNLNYAIEIMKDYKLNGIPSSNGSKHQDKLNITYQVPAIPYKDMTTYGK
jgi:DnaD/phage-associated family protein